MTRMTEKAGTQTFQSVRPAELYSADAAPAYLSQWVRKPAGRTGHRAVFLLASFGVFSGSFLPASMFI
jgi:hypothetical protein